MKHRISVAEKLTDFDNLHERAGEILVDVLPVYFNGTSASDWTFEEMIDHIEKTYNGGTSGQHISGHMHGNSSHSINHDNTISLITNALLQVNNYVCFIYI